MSLTHSHTVGSHEVIVIKDGDFQFTPDLFPGTDESTISGLLKEAGAENIETNFNAFIVKSPGRTMLVDAGPRDLFGDTCGNLPQGLKEAGVSPDEITHLMLTHLHPDHIAGAVTADGNAVFPNAQLMMSDDEHAFWIKDKTFGDENMDHWQALAKGVTSAYGDRLEIFKSGADLGQGLTALALPGHTPGHSGFRIDDGNDSFLMVCDIFHTQVLQLADPEISIAFDVDADTARDTRKKTLDMIASDGLEFSGGHLMSPKVATLSRRGKGYQLNGVG